MPARRGKGGESRRGGGLGFCLLSFGMGGGGRMPPPHPPIHPFGGVWWTRRVQGILGVNAPHPALGAHFSVHIPAPARTFRSTFRPRRALFGPHCPALTLTRPVAAVPRRVGLRG